MHLIDQAFSTEYKYLVFSIFELSSTLMPVLDKELYINFFYTSEIRKFLMQEC